MTSEPVRLDVLEQGDQAEPSDGRPRRLTREHPRWALALAVSAGAAVVLAALLHRHLGPHLPTGVMFRQVPQVLGSDAGSVSWEIGADGRPAGRTQVQMVVQLHFAAPLRDRLEVLGMSGLGLGTPQVAPGTVPRGATQGAVRLFTQADCAKVPLPIPRGVYGLRVRTVRGTISVTGQLEPVGSQAWVAPLQAGCASWRSRHDLTVTGATARIHPLRPELDLVLTVTDTGDRDAAVAADARRTGNVRVLLPGGRPARIAAGRSTRVTAHVVIDDCGSTSTYPDDDLGSGLLTTSRDLPPLVGSVGALPEDPYGSLNEDHAALLLTRSAARVVHKAVSQACGELGPIAALTPPESVHADRQQRTLRLDVVLLSRPGHVHDLVVAPAATSDPRAIVPEWTTTRPLLPDRTGAVRLTLSYRVSSDACRGDGSWFGGLDATVRTPGIGGFRVLHYNLYTDPTSLQRGVKVLCG